MDNFKKDDIDKIKEIFLAIKTKKTETIKIRHEALEFLLSHKDTGNDWIAEAWVSATLYYLASKGYEFNKKD